MTEPIYGDSATYSPLPALRVKLVRANKCDFCGRTSLDAEVSHLISTPSVNPPGVDAHICDICVGVCVRLLEAR